MSKSDTDDWVRQSTELRRSIKSLGDKGLTREEMKLRVVEIKANFVLFEAAMARMVENA